MELIVLKRYADAILAKVLYKIILNINTMIYIMNEKNNQNSKSKNSFCYKVKSQTHFEKCTTLTICIHLENKYIINYYS